MAYWLVKSEPDAWSWDDHVRAGVESWDGVRNHQAANHLRAMKIGDRAFFYHSGKQKQVVGMLEVTQESHPDPTDASGKFVQVSFKALEAMAKPVTLAAIKAEPALADIALVRHSRLSVMPIPDAAWDMIRRMGGR